MIVEYIIGVVLLVISGFATFRWATKFFDFPISTREKSQQKWMTAWIILMGILICGYWLLGVDVLHLWPRAVFWGVFIGLFNARMNKLKKDRKWK